MVGCAHLYRLEMLEEEVLTSFDFCTSQVKRKTRRLRGLDPLCTSGPHEVGSAVRGLRPKYLLRPLARVHIVSLRPSAANQGLAKNLAPTHPLTDPHRGFKQPFGCLIDKCG